MGKSQLVWQEVEEDVGRVEEGFPGPDLSNPKPNMTLVRPNTHSTRQSLGKDLALHATIYHRVWTDESDEEVICYFNHANPDTRLWNNYSSVARIHHSPGGQRSLRSPTHNLHLEIVHSHRPATCPQPAKFRKACHFIFHPFVFFISSPDSILFSTPQPSLAVSAPKHQRCRSFKL